MLNAIIVDDEEPAIHVLKLFLEKTGEVNVVASCSCASQAILKVKELRPDVAFLDIQMPDMSGLELAEEIIKEDSDMEIVFVTTYDKYALEAFRVNAIDYVLKPLSLGDITKTIVRLKKMKASQTCQQILSDKGRIYCFNRLLVYGTGSKETVKWRTSKAEELFAFMLQNINCEVSKWKIMQILWPECDMDKINMYLHTTIYKMKKTLMSANIKFEFTYMNSRYKLELPDVFMDITEFEAITKGDLKLSASSVTEYKKALYLYRGNYLEENEYLWAQSKAEEYAIRYRNLVEAFVEFYVTSGDYTNAEEILCQALTKSPLDDELNEMLLNLYVLKKDKCSLIIYYDKIKTLYKEELGIAPNSTIQNLFKSASDL